MEIRKAPLLDLIGGSLVQESKPLLTDRNLNMSGHAEWNQRIVWLGKQHGGDPD